MLIDVQQLRSFVAVVELGSMSRAATAVHLTQSAVSAQIKRLEHQLGCRVLERTTRAVRPTAPGAILLGYARGILALNEQATLCLGATSPQTGTVRLGCPQGYPTAWLLRAATALRERHPAIELRIVTGGSTELTELVRSCSLDIAVTAHCGKPAVGDVLWREPLVWAISDRLRLEGAHPIPIALATEPCPFRDAALSVLSRQRQPWRIVLTSPNGANLFAAAEAGLAVTPLTPSVMTPALRAIADGRQLPELPPVDVAMQVRAGKLDPPVAELAADLRHACHRWRESSRVEPADEMVGA